MPANLQAWAHYEQLCDRGVRMYEAVNEHRELMHDMDIGSWWQDVVVDLGDFKRWQVKFNRQTATKSREQFGLLTDHYLAPVQIVKVISLAIPEGPINGYLDLVSSLIHYATKRADYFRSRCLLPDPDQLVKIGDKLFTARASVSAYDSAAVQSARAN